MLTEKTVLASAELRTLLSGLSRRELCVQSESVAEVDVHLVSTVLYVCFREPSAYSTLHAKRLQVIAGWHLVYGCEMDALLTLHN